MKLKIFCLSVLALVMTLTLSAVAMAADFVIPEGDIAAILLNLATNYRALGWLGVLSLAILCTVQVVKKFVPEQYKFKRLITLGVSILYSILAGVIVPGSNWASVVVTVFISSGGAVALYEALKGAGIIQSPKV